MYAALHVVEVLQCITSVETEKKSKRTRAHAHTTTNTHARTHARAHTGVKTGTATGDTIINQFDLSSVPESCVPYNAIRDCAINKHTFH